VVELPKRRDQRVIGSLLRRAIVDVALRRRADVADAYAHVKCRLGTRPSVQIGDPTTITASPV
jgi:hypothetical protein